MSDEISEYSRNPEHLLLEAIHATGYSGPYANALVASESAVSRLNSTILEEFVSVSLEHHNSYFDLWEIFCVIKLCP